MTLTRRSLFHQLAIPFVVAHVVVGAVALAATARLADREERSHARDILQRTLVLSADAVSAALAADDRDSLDTILADHGTRTGITLALHDAAGDVVGRSDRRDAARSATGTLSEVGTALDGRFGEEERRSATSGRLGLHAAVPVIAGDRTIGAIRGSIAFEDLDDVPARTFGRTVLLALVSILLAGLGCLRFVSRRVDERTERLSDAARRFAAGDLGHRVDPYESRELGSLAESLNTMAAQLERRVDQLRTSSAEQRSMLDSMSAGMIALDPDQRMLRSNSRAAKLLGVDRSIRMKGRMIQEVTRNRWLNTLLDDAAATDEGVEGSVDVNERTVRVTIEPLLDQEGTRLGLIVLLTDITTMRRLERLRSEFAANVSHELRTPITNIKGYAETLAETDVNLDEHSRRFVSIITRNATRLEAIVEDLLALAGLERQSETDGLDMSSASAKAIVETVVGQLEQDAINRDIHVETDVDPDLEVVGGVHLIDQALTNLVSNAIRYCPPGTRVIVAAHAIDEDWLEISVTDNGDGIPAEHHERLFERFYRIDQARSRDVGGTGLGLAIVKHVAMAHGGRADVQSTVGEGSRFSLTLPREPQIGRKSARAMRKAATEAPAPASTTAPPDDRLTTD